MITLAEAFRLCRIGEESVYLRESGKTGPSIRRIDHYFWSTKVRNKFDMKQIKVVGIEPKFESYGPHFLGFCFIVIGITDEELRKAEMKD